MCRFVAASMLLSCLPLLASCEGPARPSHLELTRFEGGSTGFELDLVVTDDGGADLSVAGSLEVTLKYRDRVSRGARVLCRQTLTVSPEDYASVGHLTRSGAWDGACEATDEAEVWIGLTFDPAGEASPGLSARGEAPRELLIAREAASAAPDGGGVARDEGRLEIPSLGIRVVVPVGSRTAQSPGDLEESVAIETPIDDCRPAILPLPEGLGLDYEAAKEGCLGCEYQVDERDGRHGWRLRFTMPGVPGWAITRGFELGGRMLSCRASAQTENGALCALAICDSVQAL